MAQGLSPSRVVSVSISLTAVLGGFQNFGSALIVGSTPGVIDVNERARDYNGIDAVADDFGTTAPEYLAADIHFSQSPPPATVKIGRWAQTATHAHLRGAILTPTQRLVTNFQSISNGSLRILVDGVPYTLTGLNFATPLVTNLNGVASVIQTALQAAGATGATVLWNGVYYRFEVTSGSSGAVSTLGYGSAATASSNVAFSAQPAANSTLTLNGTALTFVTSNPSANQVLIGTNLAATLANLATVVNGSSDTQVSKFTAVAGPATFYLYADAAGTAGNSLTVTASGTANATVLASPMTGGGGTDISVLTGLSLSTTSTGSNAATPVPGIAAETALAAAQTLGNYFGDWYCLQFAPVTPLADSDAIQVASYIEATSRISAFTTQNTNVLDPTRSDDLASLLMASGFERSFPQFSSTSPYAATSLFARFATVNYTGTNTTITGKFKQQPGVTPEALLDGQADTLAEKNCNVYALYNDGTADTQEGVMASGHFIDQRINADWIANYLQVNTRNVLRSQPKVAQTDKGMGILVAAMVASCQQAVRNGYVAEGIWNGPPIGALNTGDLVAGGFYVYAPPVAQQTETDRAARKSVLFQIALKEAGAVHSAAIVVDVNP